MCSCIHYITYTPHIRVADLQTKVTSLKKYIKQLELERVSQFKNNGAAGIAHDEKQQETPHSSSSSTIAITTSNGVLDHCSIDSTSGMCVCIQ